ncbi:S-adenosyl-L-methionine-dependent methyltransferase [Ascodesmis nigricans]|uniref:S-adenosyl-L-methionine-dependent methyltransferase n=1 Tax=Ascodesmis nigricans TaxID=341454 RepID=A0A4S2MYW1_9PEZI|nr:S-adenosyl-L-methionine-dependent methyltransferase [Ascodesmis nigricans]
MSRAPSEVYIASHDDSVLLSHRWRTAENSAAHLLPHLAPSSKVLDVGCGPGTISIDFAKRIPNGHVTGIDYSDSVIATAQSAASQSKISNVTFAIGDVYKLDFPDNTFDIVHAHQLLQHLEHPEEALQEMRRVTKPGGLVAARESDWASMAWYPELPAIAQWHKLHESVAGAHGCEPNAGRRLHFWAHKAGFRRDLITASSTTWCWREKGDREWWSKSAGGRLLAPEFADKAAKQGVQRAELEKIQEGWNNWAQEEDGWFSIMHGEVICRKSVE